MAEHTTQPGCRISSPIAIIVVKWAWLSTLNLISERENCIACCAVDGPARHTSLHLCSSATDVVHNFSHMTQVLHAQV